MTEERVLVQLSGREQRLYDRLRGYIVKCEPGSGSGGRDLLLTKNLEAGYISSEQGIHDQGL